MMKHLLMPLVVGLFLSSCMQAPPATAASPAPEAATASDAASAKPNIKRQDFPAPKSLADNRIKGVRFIGKTVSDVDQTIAFYQKSVPFELVERYRVPASELFHSGMMSKNYGEADVALIRTATMFIKLIDFDPDVKESPYSKPPQGPGYTHICFQSPATDPALTKFENIGLKRLSINAPVDLGGYGVTYTYGRDPDGTMIENETIDRPRRDDKAWITHIGAATHDMDRIVEFYSKFIGYGPRRRGEYSNFPKIAYIAGLEDVKLRSGWFLLRNFELEFWEYIEPATPVRDAPAKVDQLGYNMTAFEVTDADAERDRLSKHGIEMIGPAKMSQGWKIYYAHDPDGNVVSIQQNISAPKSESIDDMLWIDPTKW